MNMYMIIFTTVMYIIQKNTVQYGHLFLFFHVYWARPVNRIGKYQEFLIQGQNIALSFLDHHSRILPCLNRLNASQLLTPCHGWGDYRPTAGP